MKPTKTVESFKQIIDLSPATAAGLKVSSILNNEKKENEKSDHQSTKRAPAAQKEGVERAKEVTEREKKEAEAQKAARKEAEIEKGSST